MWSLENLKSANQVHRILVSEECVVGRKDAKILIQNDPSVSRRHAILYVNHPEENLVELSKRSTLLLKDEGSKYGTFKNGARIENGQEYTLNVGDKVKFGQFQSEYRVSFSPLIVTTSCLENPVKKSLKKSIQELGGHLIYEWRPSCTHLVMSSVKITVKALCCLVSAKPIVLPNYFTDVVESYKNNSSSLESVDPDKYVPPTGEALIENASFKVNNERKHIFLNKTFLFVDEKQFKKLHLGITMGGGYAVIISEDKFDAHLVLKESTCVIQPLKDFSSSQDKISFVRSIASILQNKKKRMIPEPDVGFAVAYCSTEKFCNPDFNVGTSLLGSQKVFSQTFSLQEVYVPETEESSERIETRLNSLKSFFSDETVRLKVNKNDSTSKQTVAESQDISVNAKRKHSSEILDVEAGPSSSMKKPDIKRPRRNSYSKLTCSDLEEEFDAPQDCPPVEVKEESDSEFEILINKNPKKDKVEILPDTLAAELCTETNRFSEIVCKVEKCSSQDIKEEAVVNGHTTLITNELHTSQHTVVENIPRNLIKVEFVSLVRTVQRPTSVLNEPLNGSVKNFKKFKKVLPVGARALPKIIGAHELVAYDKHCNNNVDDWNVDDPFNGRTSPPSPFSEEERGEFDWDSLPR